MDYMNAIYTVGGAEALLNSGQLVVDDLERMARVIRELVKYIKFEDNLPAIYETENAAQRSYEARFNLSPDAKELLK